MVFVRVRDDKFEEALKLFKRRVEKEGILQEYKKRQHFEKPSDVKRRKRMEAERKAKSKKNKGRKR